MAKMGEETMKELEAIMNDSETYGDRLAAFLKLKTARPQKSPQFMLGGLDITFDLDVDVIKSQQAKNPPPSQSASKDNEEAQENIEPPTEIADGERNAVPVPQVEAIEDGANSRRRKSITSPHKSVRRSGGVPGSDRLRRVAIQRRSRSCGRDLLKEFNRAAPPPDESSSAKERRSASSDGSVFVPALSSTPASITEAENQLSQNAGPPARHSMSQQELPIRTQCSQSPQQRQPSSPVRPATPEGHMQRTYTVEAGPEPGQLLLSPSSKSQRRSIVHIKTEYSPSNLSVRSPQFKREVLAPDTPPRTMHRSFIESEFVVPETQPMEMEHRQQQVLASPVLSPMVIMPVACLSPALPVRTATTASPLAASPVRPSAPTPAPAASIDLQAASTQTKPTIIVTNRSMQTSCGPKASPVTASPVRPSAPAPAASIDIPAASTQPEPSVTVASRSMQTSCSPRYVHDLAEIMTDDDSDEQPESSSVALNLATRSKVSTRQSRLRRRNQRAKSPVNQLLDLHRSRSKDSMAPPFKRESRKTVLNKPSRPAINGEQFAEELARMSNYEILDLRKRRSQGRMNPMNCNRQQLKEEKEIEERIDWEIMRRKLDETEISNTDETSFNLPSFTVPPENFRDYSMRGRRSKQQQQRRSKRKPASSGSRESSPLPMLSQDHVRNSPLRRSQRSRSRSGLHDLAPMRSNSSGSLIYEDDELIAVCSPPSQYRWSHSRREGHIVAPGVTALTDPPMQFIDVIETIEEDFLSDDNDIPPPSDFHSSCYSKTDGRSKRSSAKLSKEMGKDLPETQKNNFKKINTKNNVDKLHIQEIEILPPIDFNNGDHESFTDKLSKKKQQNVSQAQEKHSKKCFSRGKKNVEEHDLQPEATQIPPPMDFDNSVYRRRDAQNISLGSHQNCTVRLSVEKQLIISQTQEKHSKKSVSKEKRNVDDHDMLPENIEIPPPMEFDNSAYRGTDAQNISLGGHQNCTVRLSNEKQLNISRNQEKHSKKSVPREKKNLDEVQTENIEIPPPMEFNNNAYRGTDAQNISLGGHQNCTVRLSNEKQMNISRNQEKHSKKSVSREKKNVDEVHTENIEIPPPMEFHNSVHRENSLPKDALQPSESPKLMPPHPVIPIITVVEAQNNSSLSDSQTVSLERKQTRSRKLSVEKQDKMPKTQDKSTKKKTSKNKASKVKSKIVYEQHNQENEFENGQLNINATATSSKKPASNQGVLKEIENLDVLPAVQPNIQLDTSKQSEKELEPSINQPSINDHAVENEIQRLSSPEIFKKPTAPAPRAKKKNKNELTNLRIAVPNDTLPPELCAEDHNTTEVRKSKRGRMPLVNTFSHTLKDPFAFMRDSNKSALNSTSRKQKGQSITNSIASFNKAPPLFSSTPRNTTAAVEGVSGNQIQESQQPDRDCITNDLHSVSGITPMNEISKQTDEHASKKLIATGSKKRGRKKNKDNDYVPSPQKRKTRGRSKKVQNEDGANKIEGIVPMEVETMESTPHRNDGEDEIQMMLHQMLPPSQTTNDIQLESAADLMPPPASPSIGDSEMEPISSSAAAIGRQHGVLDGSEPQSTAQAMDKTFSLIKLLTKSDVTGLTDDTADVSTDSSRISRGVNLQFSDFHGIDYAFYNSTDPYSIGYMRFQPQQVRGFTRTKRKLQYMALHGQFKIEVKEYHKNKKNENEKPTAEFFMGPGDMVELMADCRYNITNCLNEVGLLFITRNE